MGMAADSSNPADTSGLVDASKLEGTDVYDFHGQKLGELEQMLIDPQSGHIRYGVMEVDKAWNWNDPHIAIPWGSFVVKKGDGETPNLSIDATKEKLEKAPKFKVGDANRLYSKEASEPIYTYWSIYWWEEPTGTNPKNSSMGSKGTTSDGTGETVVDQSSATPTPSANDRSGTE